MRRQLLDLTSSLGRQLSQHIFKIGLRIMPAARFPRRSDPANNQFDRQSAHGRIKFSI